MTARKKKTYTFIDLFCGAGGLAEGFRQAGYRSVYAVEVDEAAARTYEKNFGHKVRQQPIETVRRIPLKADLVIGGPPCQPFSVLGMMSPRPDHAEKRRLWRHFLRIVEQVHPPVFVLENVPQFLRSPEFAKFKKRASKQDYLLTYGILNSVDFGVPQKRRRAFVLGALGIRPELPVPNGKRATVRDAIGDLPREPDGRNLHIRRWPTPLSLKRYRFVPPGGNRFDLMRRRPDITPRCWLGKPTGSTDVFGRLEWDKPALTIRTEFFKPEKGRYLHPVAHRPITHREAARLQTFSDRFVFVGSKSEIARQIGNAVPPKLAKAVAVELRRILPAATVSRRIRTTSNGRVSGRVQSKPHIPGRNGQKRLS